MILQILKNVCLRVALGASIHQLEMVVFLIKGSLEKMVNTILMEGISIIGERKMAAAILLNY